MEIVKRIIIDIYEDGTTNIQEISNFNVTESPEKEGVLIKETVRITESFTKYNLIGFSKRGPLFKVFQEKVKDKQHLKIEFKGREFEGKIDKNSARIYSLAPLMKFATLNNAIFKTGNKLELIYNADTEILKIIML